ncbi:Ribonuclease 3 [uncultured spirochete]|uniref:Ribonuclease 3 n=1 Tax=uncultured spirochete TaxID=156406 RepID=A0A3P3XTP9_9SPIR|nr:Ribonuclease 3 [uncultured spirochete]
MKHSSLSQPSGSDITASRRTSLQQFQQLVVISFHNIVLLDIAFTHSSYVNEAHPTRNDNERLEFLGDSVLGVCISHILYEKFPDKREGELARMKSVLVSESSLSAVASTLSLADYLLLGKGEENSGGRQKPAILADAAEALLGAYYLDKGLEAAKALVLRLFADKIEALASTSGKDFKSIIQEYAQKRGIELPNYKIIKIEGLEHARHFHISCVLDGETFGPLEGHTKKEAEQRAARQAFEALHAREGETARILDAIIGTNSTGASALD